MTEIFDLDDLNNQLKQFAEQMPQILRRVKLRQTLADRVLRQPACPSDRRDPAITRGEGLRRRDQTTAPFIEKRGHRRKPLPDGFDIDHHHNIWYPKWLQTHI